MKEELFTFWELNSAAIIGVARDLAAAAVIAFLGITFSRGARRLIRKASDSSLNVDGTITSLLHLVIRYGIFIICVIMILNVFGVNTASLIAVLGAAGVAVGLALKDTLGNIAAGIILLFLGSCRKGEYIEFDVYSGTVKDMNLFTTILETPDGVYVSAPNSSIWGSPLKNYSRNGKRRMELLVSIAYSDSVERAFEVMKEIIASEKRFLPDPAPQVVLKSMDDSSVSIAIRAWAGNQVYWDIYWEQMRNIKTKIEEAGLHIPFPQRDVHLISQ